jgi:hypothetical protein
MLERFSGIVPNNSTNFVVSNSAPPTWVGIDSGSVQSLLSNETGNGKSMRSYNRIIHFCRSLAREKLFIPVAVSSQEQLADIGTKQFRSPTAYWRLVSNALGDHPAILDMQERVRQAHGRSDKKRQLDGEDKISINEAGDDNDKPNTFTLNAHVPMHTDEDKANKILGQLTTENTKNNSERDNIYREQIIDNVQSGNGHLIAYGFATSQEELAFIIQTQKDLKHKLSLNSKTTRSSRFLK